MSSSATTHAIELGTVKDVAAILTIHEKTVWRWMREDDTFPRQIRLSSACSRWDLNAVRAWIAGRVEVQQ
ncbi:helix-turn-helix transcriptional regulator [Aromatoleum aromaticum]|uniref:AlpA family phage regulatory protein n=2 Tax=Aromatoleum aromaticum TaxID=551760 RepID=Q5P091_AROAE|nr:AlpA family phage regulatory protein [Aromatoleum aromaticum]NMG55388.1 AlpA family phage regulatory protein [Aromatoleum aromaticum]CAI09273.1 hypothetical protein, INTERPRO suggestion: Beta tubulin or Prophage regulatory protein [Aromatoleum aromaticum EbN1]